MFIYFDYYLQAPVNKRQQCYETNKSIIMKYDDTNKHNIELKKKRKSLNNIVFTSNNKIDFTSYKIIEQLQLIYTIVLSKNLYLIDI